MSKFHISELLGKIFNKRHEHDDDHLTIAEIMQLLHEKGFAMLLILFAMTNLIPGVASIFALVICFFAIQMIIGYDAPRLPHFISSRKVRRASLQKMIMKSMPYMKKLEGFIRPRFPILVSDKAERYLGIFIFAFAATIAIPLPLTNFVPAVGIIMVAIGLLGKDGLIVFLGVITGTIWMILLVFLSHELVLMFQ